jgi:hypothetical protein
MEFVSDAIYDGHLKSGLTAKDRPMVRGFCWPRLNVPVAFVQMDKSAEEEYDGDSKLNRSEAAKVMELVDSILGAGELTPSEIGVVTPYVAQVRLLRQKWRERCNHAKSRTKPHTTSDAFSRLEIASVDNFQGREKELIIFSAVRNNRHGQVGFLSDWRRLNVMLTRARRGLIVIGSAETLRYDPLWQQWLEWCGMHEVVIDKKAWHATVARALPAAHGICKQLVGRLRELDHAPLLPKAFQKLVRHALGMSAEEAADVWQAVSAAQAGWCGFLQTVQSTLEAAEGTLSWKRLRRAVLARFSETHENAEVTADVEEQLVESIPRKYWLGEHTVSLPWCRKGTGTEHAAEQRNPPRLMTKANQLERTPRQALGDGDAIAGEQAIPAKKPRTDGTRQLLQTASSARKGSNKAKTAAQSPTSGPTNKHKRTAQALGDGDAIAGEQAIPAKKPRTDGTRQLLETTSSARKGSNKAKTVAQSPTSGPTQTGALRAGGAKDAMKSKSKGN